MPLKALLFAAMMAAMAMLLQTAPAWIGEPAGYLLASFASLPVAVAAVAYPRAAPAALLAGALLCLLIKPQEAWVFACTNGPFGLALGRCAGAGLRRWTAILVAAGALLTGISLLTWGIGVAALGPDLLAKGFGLTLMAYTTFALLWSALFTGLFGLIYRRIAPLLPTQERRPAPPG